MNKQVDVKAILSHIVRGDGLNKCRICMGDTTEGQVHLSDTVMMDGNKPVSLSELLEIITGIQVQLEDGLPTGLCPTCYRSAFDAAGFRTFCHTAISNWNVTIQLLNTLPSQSDNQTIFAIVKNTEMIVINDNTILPSKVKEKQESHKLKLSQRNELTCPDCNKIFFNVTQLCLHLNEWTVPKRACFICAQIMSRDDLVVHLKTEHNREVFDCKKCLAILQSYHQYNQHLLLAHSDMSHTCMDCGCTYQSSQALHGHLSKHRLKTCPGCDISFQNHSCYIHHVKNCCYTYKNRNDIYITKKTILKVENKRNKKIKVGLRGSTNKECICDYCKKKFAGKKFVAAHIQIVHTKNTHRPCIYCGKLLAAAHMSEHVKHHLYTCSYTCEECGLVLKSKLGYIQHRRLHTGEKPYGCKYCGEKFSGSSRRSEHMRKMHNTSEIVNRHACEFCPATFRLPYRLRSHLNSMHSEHISPLKEYECSECKDKFGSRRGLLHHSRKHQNVNFPPNKKKKNKIKICH